MNMNSAITTQLSNITYQRTYGLIKRVMDVVISLVALIVLAPVMLIISLAIWIDSGWPIFFVQERVGKNGKLFKMYKFRTMYPRAGGQDHRAFMQAFVQGKIAGDKDGKRIYKPILPSQVTRVGRFLRKTSLDELPQLLNVLQGTMSLVGPRPNVPWEVEVYKPWHYERLEVLPGITGLAQVYGRSTISFDYIVKYDIEYVENRSLTLDLKILWKTFASVLSGEGAS